MNRIKDKDIIELYNEGNSLTRIGKILGVSYSCISKRLQKNNIRPRRHGEQENIIGQIFDRLTIISYELNRFRITYNCKCECGNYIQTSYHKLVTGHKKSCGCLNTATGSKNGAWRGHGEISGTFWARIAKNKARLKNGKECTISIEYAWELFLKQDRKCAFTGIVLTFAENYNDKSQNQTASLDRIDSTKNYIEGNVQWIHKDLNWMKQDFNDDYFIDMCCEVARNRRGYSL